MNAKLAKRLRRAASNSMQNMPERQLVGIGRCNQAVNRPETVRGLYRELKRNARAIIKEARLAT